jgi:elongation factor P
MDFKVTEAPPAIKGNTAQGGTKVVTIETGGKVNAPLFIEEGDVIKVNTSTGEYVERVEKA